MLMHLLFCGYYIWHVSPHYELIMAYERKIHAGVKVDEDHKD